MNRAIRNLPSFESVGFVPQEECVIENGVFITRNPLERKKMYCEEMFKLNNLQAAGVNLQEMRVTTHDTLEDMRQVVEHIEYISTKQEMVKKQAKKPAEQVEPEKPLNNEE